MTFEFITVPRIIFGAGEIERLGELTKALGRKGLVLYNGNVDPVRSILQGACINHITARQRGEPTVQDIDAALEIARVERCDFVIGLGGGSAIDAAKAVAGMLTNEGAASDYMEVVGKRQKIIKPAAPWLAIPTTAGTGAEVTRNAVVGWPEKKFKASIRSELLMAHAVIVDPELQLKVPPEVTARSGMDALCQCIEAYTSKNAQPVTDAMALKGVALAAQSLPDAFANGSDLAARSDMAIAALLSGIALTNAGLGAVHGFAAPLGANFPVPHGTVCGVLLPHVIQANLECGSAALRRRYADVGRAMTGNRNLADEDAAQRAFDISANLVRDLRLPPLREFGMKAEDIPPMVELAKKASSMKYNPVSLPDDALTRILARAIGCVSN